MTVRRKNLAHLLANDVGGPEIHEHAFKTLADFDADFAIFERDWEESTLISDIGPLSPKLSASGTR